MVFCPSAFSVLYSERFSISSSSAVKKIFRFQRQRGIAIVMAMLVAALATALAAALAASSDIGLSAMRGRQNHAQAVLLARGGVDYARAILAEDAKRTGYDDLSEPWATPIPEFQTEEGILSGALFDRQGCFNLNNLVSNGQANQRAYSAYRRLLALLGLDDGLALKLMKWYGVDPNATNPTAPTTPATPAIQASSRQLADFENLISVRGYDVATLDRLKQFVCVLPGNTAVNVNTTTPEVLAAILPGLDIGAAQRLTGSGKAAAYRNLADFTQALPADVSVTNTAVSLSVNTNYFLVNIVATVDNARARQNVLLYRNSTAWPQSVWQTLQ